MLTKITSAAAATTNCPVLTYNTLVFDNTNDLSACWGFRMPTNWLSGFTVVTKFTSSATSGNIVLKGGLSIATDSSTDIDTNGVYLAADLSAVTSVLGTAGQSKELSWALTTTGLAAGKWVSLFIGRDQDNASDTASGNVSLISASFQYTS